MKKVVKSLLLCSMIIGFLTFSVNGMRSEYVLDSDLILTEDIEDILKGYPDFDGIIEPLALPLTSPEDMVPQGLTIVGNHLIYTTYDSKGNENSKCFVVDESGNIVNTVTLDTSSHVGAIEYDKKNSLIWIPGENGSLNAYEVADILMKDQAESKYHFAHVGEGLVNYKNDSKLQISYLTIFDDYIFLGSFSKSEKGIVKKYKISKIDKETIELVYVDEFAVPAQVQGITFYEKGGTIYMMLSCSYGRTNASYIKVFEYSEEKRDYWESELRSFKLPPLLEQISVNGDNLYILFEGYASVFVGSRDLIKSICVLSIDRILEGD